MNDYAAIQGTFVKVTPVASRKVTAFHIEVPVELTDKYLQALGGYPDPANPKWVAVALLNMKAVQHKDDGVRPPKEPRRWNEIAWSQQSAIACSDQSFRRFLFENDMLKEDELEDEKAAATAVRLICGVNTRADIKSGTPAGEKWYDLHGKYKAWEITP